jgi:hypothetical protein
MKSPHLLVDVRDVNIAGDTNAISVDSDGSDGTADKFANKECQKHFSL